MMTAYTESILSSRTNRNHAETCTTSAIAFQSNSTETAPIERVLHGDSDAFFDLVRPSDSGVFLAPISLE